MEAEAAEFQDWELLHNSESVLFNGVDSDDNLKQLDGFEGVFEGFIKSDYFSLKSNERYESHASKVEEDGWIDPGCSENLQFERKISSEVLYDSSSDGSIDHESSDPDLKNELASAELLTSREGFEGEDSSKFWSDAGLLKSELPNNENGLIKDLSENNADFNGFVEGEIHEAPITNETEIDNVAIEEVKRRGNEEKRGIIWLKLPLELLKYCVFRANPVWSVSMAAAAIGLLILGQRLYKMKRKARTLLLNVTMDDHKVSQFTARVARLNEAFSVVRRVPMIRPSMPASGITPWPVMSLR